MENGSSLSLAALSFRSQSLITGFGELTFYLKDGKICCHNEYMSRKFVKQVLEKLVEIVDLDDKKKD